MMEKLNILEHVRKRPGMYIGSVDHYGYSELISSLIEDFIKAGSNEMNFLLKSNNQLIIEGCSKTLLLPVLKAVKYSEDYKADNFYVSMGVVVALSEKIRITINDECILQSEKGNLTILEDLEEGGFNRIKIHFTPDRNIFNDLVLNYEKLNNVLRRFAFLNSSIKIKSTDESRAEKQINIFHYPKGLEQMLNDELEKGFIYSEPVFKLNFQKNTEFSYSVALAFVDCYWLKHEVKVYAHNEETVLGGSLLDGILQGVKKFLRDESLKRNFKLSIGNAKLRKYLFIYASVRGNLSYSGSTKWRLGTPEVKTEIRKFVYQELKLYFKDKDHKVSAILERIKQKK